MNVHMYQYKTTRNKLQGAVSVPMYIAKTFFFFFVNLLGILKHFSCVGGSVYDS